MTLIAEYVNIVVGFFDIVHATFSRAGLKIIDNSKETGELKCMYVLPDIQGQGFGQLLIDKVITKSKQIKLKHIRLDVKINAYKAIKLYRKNGFYVIPRYNDNKNDVIFMELKI